MNFNKEEVGGGGIIYRVDIKRKLDISRIDRLDLLFYPSLTPVKDAVRDLYLRENWISYVEDSEKYSQQWRINSEEAAGLTRIHTVGCRPAGYLESRIGVINLSETRWKFSSHSGN